MSQQEKDKPGYHETIFRPACSNCRSRGQDVEESATVVVESGQNPI